MRNQMRIRVLRDVVAAYDEMLAKLEVERELLIAKRSKALEEAQEAEREADEPRRSP